MPEQAVLAVLYTAGRRPSIDAVRLAGEATGAFALTFDPGECAGWAELLVTGLTFEAARDGTLRHLIRRLENFVNC